MIKKMPLKRLKVKEVIGNNASAKELAYQTKYNIYRPEDQSMIVTNEGPKGVTEFERYLKEKYSRRLFIKFNETIPSQEEPFGHAIRYYDETLPNKYDFVSGVGCGGSRIIPSMSTYKHYKNEEKNLYETRLEYKGWKAAEEQVVSFMIGRGK